MSPPRITALEPSFITGHWGDLFIGVWRRAATVADVNEWARQREHMAVRHPSGFVTIGIVEADTPVPDEPIRLALAAALSRHSSSIRATATVQEASGFAGSAFRSVMLSLNNSSKILYPHSVFGSVGEAAVWLAPSFERRSPAVSSAQIVAAVDEFRALIEPSRGRSGDVPRAAI
jgi:hypothetical protein